MSVSSATRRQAAIFVANADQTGGVFHRRGVRLAEQHVVQWHQAVLQLARPDVVALGAGRLEVGAQTRRDIRRHRNAAHPAMRVEPQRRRIFAGNLNELAPAHRTLLRDARDVGRRVLNANDVGNLGQPAHRVDRDVDGRTGRHVVEKDWQARGLGDRGVVQIETFLRRPVVIRSHHQRRIRPQLLRELGHFDGMGG
jgi:hypothetical protein